jgi:hypothetical protein
MSRSSMQSEEAGDEENDDDDADDVENIHGVLRLRYARFQHESAALQQKRSVRQVSSKCRGSYLAVKMVNFIQTDAVNGHTPLTYGELPR